MKLKTWLFLPSLALSISCSDKEQIVTVVKTKPQPQLEVIGATDEPIHASLYQTIDSASKSYFKMKPQFASLVGINQQDAGYYYHDKLDNYELTAEVEFRKFLRAKARLLNQIESNHQQLDEDNRKVMANLFRFFAGSAEHPIGFIDAYFGHQPYIINQINGPMIDTLYTFTDGQKIISLTDAQNYLQRVIMFAEQIKQVEKKFVVDAEQGWIPPVAIIHSALTYLDGYNKVAVKDNRIYTHFIESLTPLTQINETDKNTLIAKLQQVIAQNIYPAFRQVSKTVASYQDKAPTGDGIWAQPGGDRFYQYSIKSQGDSNLSAAEIHNIGLQEVVRISADMDSILNQLNYQQGSVSQRINALAKESRFSYPATDAGRQQVIDDLNTEINRINEIMPSQFKTPIKYQVEVKAFPKEIEEGNSGGQYNPPTLDGSKPGVFWINLRDIENLPKFDLPTLTFHETNPGHHWQISLNMAQAQLPVLRKFAAYNAYVEGWALYAEQVAYEMGIYQHDPYANLGRLKAEIFRAVRLVVDTGIHYKKWTREQAIDYMMENTGAPLSEAKAEIERYMAWPGQALGYKLGMLKILNLRKQAKELLGDQFDIAEFHDVVLLNGALPMAILEQKVNDWIASK
ncbi:DUF885 domain-containing protein [Thalassotalea sp. ND16A]|uniref:DUF885 domain-containing protein n=1 Tax=Thalassotalea sp. ND16A TaxID=1535422 RepID=UPI00051A3D95|nr:DUF885 domain-containing protein [Thalassotalea sp. ND16A]KGJ95818.1 hypothetical protein ND16A_1353 [Thalassotalea sp. ND16A]